MIFITVSYAPNVEPDEKIVLVMHGSKPFVKPFEPSDLYVLMKVSMIPLYLGSSKESDWILVLHTSMG